MNIITYNSLKGGSGKTTLLYVLSNELLKRNKRILLIDLDSQCNTSALYDQEYNREKNVYKMFHEKNIDSNIVNVKYNLDLIPGSIQTSILSNELMNSVKREEILAKAIRDSSAAETYDYILVDTHPDFSIVTQNALIISHMIISPIIPNQFSFQGIELLNAEWKKFREEIGIDDSLILLINTIKSNTKSSTSFLKDINTLKDNGELVVFNNTIPHSEIFNKITLNKNHIEDYTNSKKIVEYVKLFVDELQGYLE